MESVTDDNASLRVASFACYLDTAEENLVHRVSALETPVTFNSGKAKPFTTKAPLNSNFSYSKDNKESLNSLRADSFSYVSTAGENFVVNVPKPIEDHTSAFTFSQDIPKEGEISVFGADKYFNMTKLEHESKKQVPLNLPRVESNAGMRHASLCSEASSWNNQAALVPNTQRNRSERKHKKAIGGRFFSGFCCLGPCFNKKDIHINKFVAEELYHSSKPTRTGSERIDHLALVLAPNPATENFKRKKQQLQEVPNVDESRNSMEVFGCGMKAKGDVAANMERKLSMLTWDAIPKGQTVPTHPVRSITSCDDMASDASSDLFEIENITGSMYPLLTSAAADDMSSCMSPVSLYAPSEASIQWSVVTASAAEYSSVLSDYNDESVGVVGGKMSRNDSKNVMPKP